MIYIYNGDHGISWGVSPTFGDDYVYFSPNKADCARSLGIRLDDEADRATAAPFWLQILRFNFKHDGAGGWGAALDDVG